MKKFKGFTLVEMVIVIAIVIVLSTISVPIYKDYISEAKLAEGYSLLRLIRDAQLKYYDEYRIFLIDTNSSHKHGKLSCNEDVLAIDARANKYFTSFNINWCGTTSHATYQFNPMVWCNDGSIMLHLFFNLTLTQDFYISDRSAPKC
ncbi:MAG: prepilin-type N-terminal cleavage/methylation domain-containing protein [Elusimicrobia bacterium]|nr:prepilin-type N-terminal cleavage/methylation domain-containing protein [Elusimicrobiota bacterium]